MKTWEAAQRVVARLATDIERLQPWRLVPRAAYDPRPVAPGVLRVKDSSWFAEGLPVKWASGPDVRYGIVAGTPAKDQVLIAGPSLGIGTIDALFLGRPELVVQRHIWVPATFGNLTGQIVHYYAGNQYQRPVWTGPPAYLVDAMMRYAVAPAGGGPPQTYPWVQLCIWRVSVGTYLLTPSFELQPNGPAVSEYHTRPPLGSVDPTKYRIQTGWCFDLFAVTPDNGNPTRAGALSGAFTFVLE